MPEKLYLCTHEFTLPSTTIRCKKSSRLKNLCIRGGDFVDDKVAYEIAQCFKLNCVLMHVELYSVRPSDEARASLQIIHMHGLEHNTTLQHLDMRIIYSGSLENKVKGVISLINEEIATCPTNALLQSIMSLII